MILPFKRWQNILSFLIKITGCDFYRLIFDSKNNVDPSHRQDYAVFLRFEFIGSKDGFLRDDNYKTIKSKCEINEIMKLIAVWII